MASGDIDELTIAEVAFQRQGQLALGGGVFGVGTAFMNAARSLEKCTGLLVGCSANAVPTAREELSEAAEDALIAVARLEAFFSRAPDPSSPLMEVLQRLTGQCAEEPPGG